MGKRIIRPIKGIDVDSALNRRDDNSIYMAKNLRPNNSEDLSLGAYVNINGIQYSCFIQATSNILKLAKVGSKLIIFVKISGISDPDRILLIDESDIPSDGSYIILDYLNYYWSTGDLLLKGEYGFDADNDISVKTYYESDTSMKIYWTTGTEPLRSLNVIKTDYNDPSSYSENDLCLVPDADLSIPVIKKTISGSLKCGKIYYAYKLVTPNGAETNLSELSFPYHLTKSSELNSTDALYGGYGIDVDSTKGCVLEITGIPSVFSRAKVYSIHYINDTSLPVIRLIYDNTVASSIIISDIGTSILDISAEEFISINSIYNNGGVLEVKNNRLFLSNYSETFFNIDDYYTDAYHTNYWEARAYRFNSSRNTRIYQSDLVTYNDYAYNSSWYTIPHDHDCINADNNYSVTTPTYKYQSNGSTIGAEGENITISELSSYYTYPDKQGTNAGKKWCSQTSSSYQNSYMAYSNPYLSGTKKTFKLEEVYRIGIQFKNSFGQLSYPKWICDYKFFDTDFGSLDYFTGSTGSANFVESKIGLKVKAISVTVNNIPNDPITGSPFEYRIMFVPISEADEGVHWGMYAPLTRKKINGDASYNYFMIDGLRNTSTSGDEGSGAVSNDYLQFVSPDYCFGNSASYSSGRITNYSYAINDIIYDNKRESDGYPEDNKNYCYINKLYKWTDYSKLISITGQYNITYENGSNSGVDFSLANLPYDLLSGSDRIYKNTRIFYHDSQDYQDAYRRMFQPGRCQIFKFTEGTHWAPGLKYAYLGCAYINVFQSKYGGLSYEARSGNGYIPLSQFTSSSTLSVYGDSYITLFEHLRLIGVQGEWEDGTKESTLSEVNIFPTITKLNLNLRSDLYMTKEITKPGSIMMKESAGIYQSSLLIDNPTTYTQPTDLYLYNMTYSKDQDLLLYYLKQDIDSVEVNFGSRIIASENKILGEKSDSFLKFGASNYIDVDAKYGNILALENYNNRLYFFQEKAIGIAATNERASTSTTEGGELVMGTTELLSRFDYLTLYNGISKGTHVKKSATQLYAIDSKNKLLLLIGESVIKLSIIKNVDSFVKSKYWDDAIIVYNQKYNEILFIYKDTSDSTETHALVYNELMQVFTGIYEYKSLIIGSERIDGDINDEVISIDRNTSQAISILNNGYYNKLGSSYVPSEITYLISTNNESNALFNVVELIAKQIDDSGVTNDFIDTIRFYNNIDDSGELDFATLTSYKFGKYRTNKLRNTSSKRILSDHLYVQIKTRSNLSAENSRVFFRDLTVLFNEYNYFI